MKHNIMITPLNCAFGLGLNSILRMELADYTADAVRSIYCKSPDISWFKMKSVSAAPYLEPAFYGLKPGDTIDIEFDALAKSGSAVIDCRMVMISGAYATGTTIVNIATDTLKPTFKRYKTKFVIPTSFAAGIGVNTNIRPSDASLNSEIIIKNIEVSIQTSNSDFSMVNNIVAYRTKTDFMQCIDYVSGSNLNATYNSLLTVFDAGQILFPDDFTMQHSGADVTNFKGLMCCLNGYKYRPACAIYAEIVSVGGSGLTATVKNVSEASVVTQVGSDTMGYPATLTKKIIYINGSTTLPRKTLIDLGMVGGGNFSMKNVRFSMPQFDDSVKREPNKLEELYTSLRLKLR